MHAFLCSFHPPRYSHLVITASDQQFLGLTVAFACVADPLNLLYELYTNGLEECVGRLQRRLPLPFLKTYLVNRTEVM